MKVKSTEQIVNEVIKTSMSINHNNEKIWDDEEMRKDPTEYYQPEVSTNPPLQNDAAKQS